MNKLDLLCFGEPLYEFNQGSDGNYQPGFGGDTSNCAIAASRSGADVGVLTHIGDDYFGDCFMDLWRDEDLSLDGVRQVEGGETGLYFVTHDGGGHHYNYRRKRSAVSLITAGDLPVELIRNSRILHVSGISQAISENAALAVFEAIKLAKEFGNQVSYDTNLRLKLWSLDKAREVIHEAVGQCDIVLPGLDDAIELTKLSDPNAIVDFYLDLDCPIVALTLGSEGVLVATRERRELLASHKVNAIDANGAGDTFDGAFLAHYQDHQNPFEAARFANAAAALSTTRSGAVRSMPRKQEIEDFLAASPQ